MFVTFDTSHHDISLLKDIADQNMLLISVTFDTSHVDMPLLNTLVLANVPDMSVALDVSHLDTSALKDAALNQPNLVAYTQRVSERWFADDPMSVQREVSTT